MYNRYIRNDQGSYTRVQEEEPASRQPSPPGQGESPHQEPPHQGPREQAHQERQEHHEPPPHEEAPPHQEPPPHSGRDPRSGFITGALRKLLDQLHLDNVDTGDLLLLLILFFLFEEGAEEELLIALGLMLIL